MSIFAKLYVALYRINKNLRQMLNSSLRVCDQSNSTACSKSHTQLYMWNIQTSLTLCSLCFIISCNKFMKPSLSCPGHCLCLPGFKYWVHISVFQFLYIVKPFHKYFEQAKWNIEIDMSFMSDTNRNTNINTYRWNRIVPD